jgi:hypothetical protein
VVLRGSTYEAGHVDDREECAEGGEVDVAASGGGEDGRAGNVRGAILIRCPAELPPSRSTLSTLSL